MFCKIVEKPYSVDIPSKDTLLSIVSLSERRVVLFFRSLDAVVYDLRSSTILHTTRLKSLVVAAEALTDSAVVCTVKEGDVWLLKVNQNKIDVQWLGDVPKQNWKFSKRSTIFKMNLVTFRDAGTFLLKQIIEDHAHLFFFSRRRRWEYSQTVIKRKNLVIQKINNKNLMASFSQFPEKAGRWVIQFCRAVHHFGSQIYRLKNDIFSEYALVQEVRQVREGSYLIAVNADARLHFLAFTPQSYELTDYTYSADTILSLDSHFFSGFMMSVRLFGGQHNNVECKDVVDLVKLESGEVYSQLFTSLYDVEQGWERNYLISYNKTTNKKSDRIAFNEIKTVKKESIYLKLMNQIGLESRFGMIMLEKVFRLLSA